AKTFEEGYEAAGVPRMEKRIAYANQFAGASAPPPPAPAPPVNGSVDVNITHTNPPPNSAVTASGSGSVKVAPPRTERTQVDMGSP
ncbi:MAG TPA: hypothetical protein VHS58_08565, partial [Acetobacteraceae bacterium]|nr:hypothetical protein [Acetobacteraceae bacterium]